jgi:hypothetical protein
MNSGNGLERGIIILSNSSKRYAIYYTIFMMDLQADGRCGKMGDMIS